MNQERNDVFGIGTSRVNHDMISQLLKDLVVIAGIDSKADQLLTQ